MPFSRGSSLLLSMAKWGEGDPRWIVEERADAKNVNNWHWTEKNASQWSIDKIHSLLDGLVIDSDDIFCEITSITKCDGEAVANNRKAKLIFFYEWVIEGDWTGHKKKSQNKTKFTGKIEVNNLSEEYTADELDVTVTCQSSSEDAQEVKEFMRIEGTKMIRRQLSTYISDLKEEYGKDLILPTKDSTTKSNSTAVPTEGIATMLRNSNSAVAGPTCNTPVEKSKMVDITLEEDFPCSPQDLFNFFTSEELTKSFTRSDAKINAVVDGAYRAFGGNISGTFCELKPPSLISMSWRKQNWPADHLSLVKLEFTPSDSGTHLTLTQSNVPASDVDGTKSGWSSHYFMGIRRIFDCGGGRFT
ncbi:unnamed protein product [Schistocephalus solidus]|uniref:Activator of Hsp90 ATPase AHSA1-like N-terminal domain-containing protein n=1 Tax=Schistocephalus solidus TaxID=70667 RepID=A0A3P7E2U4_SCHSO|nr:unnamed protein product [Schistocephalus solidus]